MKQFRVFLVLETAGDETAVAVREAFESMNFSGFAAFLKVEVQEGSGPADGIPYNALRDAAVKSWAVDTDAEPTVDALRAMAQEDSRIIVERALHAAGVLPMRFVSIGGVEEPGDLCPRSAHMGIPHRCGDLRNQCVECTTFVDKCIREFWARHR